MPSTTHSPRRKINPNNCPARSVFFEWCAASAGLTAEAMGRKLMAWKRCIAVALPLTLIAVDANAQSWPVRPIEMIIPFPAGGSVDVIGRAVATAISEELGQQVVISNRDGASG